MNISKLLIQQAKVYAEKVAVFFKDTEVSFLELKDNAFKVANFLISRGIKKSDKITVFVPNSLEAVFSYLGVLSMGAVLVPLDFMFTESEIINFINHSESKVLIIQPKKGIEVLNVKKSCPGLEEIIIVQEQTDSFTTLEEILATPGAKQPVITSEEDDLSSIFYTSGSTGHPKGVMLTYKHFNNTARAMVHFMDVTSGDVLCCAGLPFSHLGGFDYLLCMLSLGNSLVLIARFQPLEVLRSIQKYSVTYMWLVPPMYVAMLSLKEYEKFKLSSLRYVIVFGAPSSPAYLRKFHKLCPQAHFINGWGMTETAAPNCYLPPGETRIESVGKFTPGLETKIVDEQGHTLGVNQSGELWVKGELVMVGYYKEPELTNEVITQDGWLKTGDMAKFDEQGLCYIIGRKKDMIKVAGEIVFPAELEEKIHLHPKIKEVAVIGVPDNLRGEVPKAFIVLKDNASFDAEELRKFLKTHLAHFKLPHYFEFVGELPKNRAGKIDKVKLRKN